MFQDFECGKFCAKRGAVGMLSVPEDECCCLYYEKEILKYIDCNIDETEYK